MEDNGDLFCLPCVKYFIVNPLGGGEVTRNSGVGRNTCTVEFVCRHSLSYLKNKKVLNHKFKGDFILFDM